ncbi:MAG: MAPEG family protein [Pseudomonadota bacterium]
MVTWLLLGIAVHFLAVFLPGLLLVPRMGLGAYLGSRDDEPGPDGMYGRARRILRNSNENLAAFVGLAVAAIAIGKDEVEVLPVGSAGSIDMETAILGAMIFVIARLAFIPLYLFGVPVVRTLAWVAGLIGLILMGVALL